MLPRHWIEAYLRFLLRRRVPISIAIAAGTLFFLWFTATRLTIFTNFFDLYPPRHEYIETYTKYRSMFGTSNNMYAAPTDLVAINAQTITSTGGSQAHENMQPFLTISFCIALQGIYPSPS